MTLLPEQVVQDLRQQLQKGAKPYILQWAETSKRPDVTARAEKLIEDALELAEYLIACGATVPVALGVLPVDLDNMVDISCCVQGGMRFS
jgi:hypothetical protein